MPDRSKHPAANGGKWLAPDKRLAIHLRDDFTCLYCGRDLRAAEPRVMQVDHVKCWSHGGSNDPTNLVTACRTCNCGRGNKKVEDYASAGAVERVHRQRKIKLAPYRKLAKAIIAGETGDPREELR